MTAKPAGHDHTLGDVRVRSVATNIRTWDGDGTERHGNSIFIFEVGALCIAHLGHPHHTLTQQQLNEIGRVDVVLVPVDGTYTLDVEGMLEVMQALKAPLMIPMHYFSTYTLNRFLDRVRSDFDVEFSETPSVVLSKAASGQAEILGAAGALEFEPLVRLIDPFPVHSRGSGNPVSPVLAGSPLARGRTDSIDCRGTKALRNQSEAGCAPIRLAR